MYDEDDECVSCLSQYELYEGKCVLCSEELAGCLACSLTSDGTPDQCLDCGVTEQMTLVDGECVMENCQEFSLDEHEVPHCD